MPPGDAAPPPVLEHRALHGVVVAVRREVLAATSSRKIVAGLDLRISAASPSMGGLKAFLRDADVLAYADHVPLDPPATDLVAICTQPAELRLWIGAEEVAAFRAAREHEVSHGRAFGVWIRDGRVSWGYYRETMHVDLIRRSKAEPSAEAQQLVAETVATIASKPVRLARRFGEVAADLGASCSDREFSADGRFTLARRASGDVVIDFSLQRPGHAPHVRTRVRGSRAATSMSMPTAVGQAAGWLAAVAPDTAAAVAVAGVDWVDVEPGNVTLGWDRLVDDVARLRAAIAVVEALGGAGPRGVYR